MSSLASEGWGVVNAPKAGGGITPLIDCDWEGLYGEARSARWVEIMSNQTLEERSSHTAGFVSRLQGEPLAVAILESAAEVVDFTGSSSIP